MKHILKKKNKKNLLDVFIKLALAAFVFLFLIGIVYLGIRPYHGTLREGDISLRDVFAPFDFSYQTEIDEDATISLKKEALSEVTPVYRFDSANLIKAEKGMTQFFEDVKNARQTQELFGDDEKLEALQKVSPLKLSKQTLLAFIRTAEIDKAENAVKSIFYGIADRGILSKKDIGTLAKKEGLQTVSVFDSASNTEEEIAVSALLDIAKAKTIAEKEIAEGLGKDRKIRKASNELVQYYLEPNLALDSQATLKKTETALGKISPVYKEDLVKKNELLIARGQRIGKKHIKKIDQLNIIGSLRGKASYLVGLGIILAIFLVLAIIYLRLYEPKTLRNNKNLLLIALNIIFITSIAQTIVLSPWSSYLIPLASISMLLTILINADVAFLVTILMSIFCGVITGNRFGVSIICLVGAAVGIFSVMKVRRRSQLFVAGALVGIANFFTIVGMGYLNNLMLRVILTDGMWGLLSGFLSFFIVMGLLPILESLFKFTTDITLLEMSDLNHPILKEMVVKAPGTYHHSLIVGNLAEAACDAIGANSLLARVGSYYHDIGKIHKPEYFTENETAPNSRHEGLTPSMSALIITNHVKDGLDLAKKYKLNPVIKDFIGQHHGNSLIYYFYQKALEKGIDQKELKDDAFRYPGPRPQTKEAATVLLADSVEASSRTLTNPIPSRIKELVQRIINNKFIDGQLDDCELSLKDLNRIAESFVRTLGGIFHTRVEYPKEKNGTNSKNHGTQNRDKKPNGKKDSAQAQHKEGDNKNT